MAEGAITVGILGETGDGKTTSIVINPDGKCAYLKDNHPNKATVYQGMNPTTTVIFNCDGKRIPFPLSGWPTQNVIKTSDIANIKKSLINISKSKIKAVVIDTINALMIDKEMMESKKMTFDKWYDFAKEIYELITLCNSLREDLIIYFIGHATTYTNVDGNESKCLITNGKKLEKIKLESKLPIVLFTNVNGTGESLTYSFETQKNRSTAKSPLGMFPEFMIPNSLNLVDTTIRKFYGIE